MNDYFSAFSFQFYTNFPKLLSHFACLPHIITILLALKDLKTLQISKLNSVKKDQMAIRACSFLLPPYSVPYIIVFWSHVWYVYTVWKNFFECKINEFKYSGGIADCEAINSWICVITTSLFWFAYPYVHKDRMKEQEWEFSMLCPSGEFSSNFPALVSHYLLLT